MIEFIKENIVLKKWGYEKILHNRADYCAKILHFNKGGRFSMHFHLQKTETWYVAKGEFDLYYINTDNADLFKHIEEDPPISNTKSMCRFMIGQTFHVGACRKCG